MGFRCVLKISSPTRASSSARWRLGYFTPLQQELLREFVDRRGGGLLFLGGRFALAMEDGAARTWRELLPTCSAQQQDHVPP